jgi:hypothetical protein
VELLGQITCFDDKVGRHPRFTRPCRAAGLNFVVGIMRHIEPWMSPYR